jgi:arsenate reductase
MTSGVTIYHNPRCGTSRKTLEIIRGNGIEPTIVEYLEHPPSRTELERLAQAAGGVRTLLRAKEALCAELGLDDPRVTDKKLIDAMLKHPILINRPIVSTRKGVRLCRPQDVVLEIL